MATSLRTSGLVLFAIMLAHALLETARDALFLAKLGADVLALAYLAIAAVALVAVLACRRWSRGRHPRRMLLVFLMFATAGTSALAATIAWAPALAFVLYVWTGLVATLVVPMFWLTIDSRLGIDEAKRSFAAVAAGGGLGALAGSALSTGLARFLPAHWLLTASAVALVGATFAAAFLVPREDAEPVRPPHKAAPALPPATAHYLRLLLLLAVVSTIALTLGDLMFKRLLAERIATDQLALVFGAVYTALNVIGLIVQVAITARLLEKAGVGTALMVLPMIVLASATGFLLTGALVTILVLKLADGGLRYSVHRVVSEILFLPMSPSARDERKPMVDVIGQRGGQALAAFAAMMIAGGAAGTHALALLVTAGVVAWLAVIVLTRRAYVQQFRATLGTRGSHHEVGVPALDAVSVAMLQSALASPDEAEAAAALDLLATRKEAIPALVLYHPNPAIVRRALASLGDTLRPDIVRILEHLSRHADPLIRAAAIAAANRTGYQATCLAAARHDPSPDVRAAAIVASYEDPQVPAAGVGLMRFVHGSVEDRTALARAIGRDPRPVFRDVLVQLFARRETPVVREILQIWEQEPALADIDLLIRLLDQPHVRGDVRRAIEAVGNVQRLTETLDDPRAPLEVRRQLPHSISRFRSRPAFDALIARLLREPDGATEFKILRALGHMRADDPSLPVPTPPLRSYMRRSVGDAARYRRLTRALARTEVSPATALLCELMTQKRREAIDRAFRALAVLHPDADLRRVHDGFVSTRPDRRAAAREILDEVLPLEERAPLVDELQERDPITAELYLTHADVISALLVDPSDSVRCIAAHDVAQRRLISLRADLVRLRPVTGSTFVTLAFDQAIARLDA